MEHVRIIPVVEGRAKGVPAGEVTQNEGQQSQQTQQTPHRGGSTILQGFTKFTWFHVVTS